MGGPTRHWTDAATAHQPTLPRRLGLALLATLLLAGSASATPLLGSSFDSQDGDQLPTAFVPVVKDWQSVAPEDLLTVNVDPLRVDTTVIPNKKYDGCFIGGVKEDSRTTGRSTRPRTAAPPASRTCSACGRTRS